MTHANWNHELTQTGRVIFRTRRPPLVFRLVFAVLATINFSGGFIASLRGERPWGPWEIIAVVIVPMMVWFFYTALASLLTGRPAMIVDQNGITLTKEHLAWHEIASIEYSTRTRLLTWWAIVAVARSDPRRRSIEVSHDIIRHPAEVARWLTSRLDQHRSPESSTPSQDEPSS